MKKIYLMMFMAAGLLASCELETEPKGYLPDEGALAVPANFKAARVNLYTSMKSMVSSRAFNMVPELQADYFNAVSGFSNAYSANYRWESTTQTSEYASVYGGCQGGIMIANWIIDGYNSADLSNENVFPKNPTTNGKIDTDQGLLVARKAKGEAFFTRAYCIFQLAQYFCAAYDPATADNANTGASYMLHYNPSIAENEYPGRNTLNQTYQQVYDDLDSAALYINQAGVANCPYVSVEAINALRARVALSKGDWQIALDNAEPIIDGGNYSLAMSDIELENMYLYDSYNVGSPYTGVNESLFTLTFGSSAELGGQQGYNYLPYQEGKAPDYLPTKSLLDLYSDDDYRLAATFYEKTIATTTGTAGTVKMFNKYPDHGIWYLQLMSEGSRFVHEPMMFRIAEMYLIAAEASINLNKLKAAKTYLEELQDARNYDYSGADHSTADGLYADLKNERVRELVGEGFRLFDIKRWHLPVARGVQQQRDLCSLPGPNTTDLYRAADDNQLTWPIPKQEMDVNKNVKQNPGW